MRYAITAAVLSLSTAGFSPAQSLPKDTNEITTLTVDQADALAKQEHKNNLFLNGLTTLPPDVATALARHEGELSLDGLTTLSDEAARALAQHEGDLYLDGLTTLSDEAAKALAQHKGWLCLRGLTTLLTCPR